MLQECRKLKPLVFGMVHSQKLVAIFVQKCFTSRRSTVFNSINIITNCGAYSDSLIRLRYKPVVGSIAEGAIKIFHWHNLAGCTRAVGSTQPLKEMRPGKFLRGLRQRVRRADNLTVVICQISGNLGASTSWNPLQPAVVQHRDCCTFNFATDCAYVTMSKSNITLYVNKSAYYV